MKHVAANCLLLACYGGLFLIGDWLYVRGGQTHEQSLAESILGLLLSTSVVPIACFLNWKLLHVEGTFVRLVLGILLGLTALAIGFLPFVWILIHFHIMIGGSL